MYNAKNFIALHAYLKRHKDNVIREKVIRLLQYLYPLSSLFNIGIGTYTMCLPI